MMQHTRGQNEVKAACFLVNRGQADIAAKKMAAVAEPFPRRFHVSGINIEPEIVYGGQVFLYVPGPAADVQNLLPGYGSDVFGDVDAPTVTPNEAIKQPVNRG